MHAWNKNIEEVIDLAHKLLFLADKGDIQREDDGCGVLYGIVRDCAYKLKLQAEQEKENHIQQGIWERDDKKAR
ncbi:MAG: hypothetical protein GF401_15100 [Chitinivibrionales bacterium]|nr:hypothetical protein [Chitinivibrionales bacterium]